LRTKLIIILATATVLGAAIVACSSLKGGEEAKTAEAPAPAPVPAPEPEVGKIAKTKVGNTTTYAGVLRGVNDSNKFDVFTEKDKLEVEFDWPDDSSYYVKVLGTTGNELGDFDLAEGKVIELTGGGKFSLVVYSKKGEGPWTATYTE